jgi:hypothetical protein
MIFLLVQKLSVTPHIGELGLDLSGCSAVNMEGTWNAKGGSYERAAIH